MIVGREAELTALTAAFEQMLAGRGSVLFLTGEAGLGKTTLVHSWISDERLKISDSNNGARLAPKSEISHQQSYIFLESACSIPIGNVDVGRLEALQPWIDVIAQLESTVAASPSPAKLNLGKIVRDVAPAWAMAIPMVGELAHAALETVRLVNEHREGMRQPDSTANPNAQNQQQVFQQYVNLIASVSATQPLVIFLDDLHWADTSSCNLLFYLARQITDKRILVIATYRQDDAMQANDGKGHAIISVKNELVRYGIGRELALGQLTREAIHKLLTASFPSLSGAAATLKFETWLHRISSGNSLFVTQYVKTLREDGLLTDDGGFTGDYDAARVPESALAVVEERARRLDEPTRELLTYATAEGEEFTAYVLERLTERKPMELMKALQRAENTGMIVKRGSARAFANKTTTVFGFSHALFHKALYDSLYDEVKESLHRTCYELLLAEWVRLAPTKERTTTLATKLLTHAEKCEEWATVAEVALAAAREFWRTYNEDEALAMAARVHAAAERGSALVEANAQALYLRGDICLVRGRFPEGIEAFQAAERGFRAAALPARAVDALHGQVWCRYRLADTDAALGTAELALEEARRIGYALGEAVILNARGVVRSARTHGSEALEDFEASLAISESIGDRQSSAWVLGNLGSLHLDWRRFAEASECHLKSLELHRSLGNLSGEAAAHGGLAGVYGDQAMFTEALEHLRRCLSIFESIGDRRGMATALGNLGGYYLSQGRHEEARDHLERSMTLQELIGERQGIARTLCNLGKVDLSLGRHADALAQFERGLAAAERIGDVWGVAMLLVHVGLLLTLTGNLPESRAALERAVTISSELKHPYLTCCILGELGKLEELEAEQLQGEARARHLQVALGHLQESLGSAPGSNTDESRSVSESLARVQASLDAQVLGLGANRFDVRSSGSLGATRPA